MHARFSSKRHLRAVLLRLVPDGVASRFRRARVGRSVCDLQLEASVHLIYNLAFSKKAEFVAGVLLAGDLQFATRVSQRNPVASLAYRALRRECVWFKWCFSLVLSGDFVVFKT